jgi:hypothetical protein
VKVFNLKCPEQHVFEGWFKTSEAFETQRREGLLACPFCGSHEIEKGLSAPRLNLTSGPEVHLASGLEASDWAKMVQAVRKVLEKSEDVGDRFAEEARAIRDNEAPSRPIHGQTSYATAQELAEEGIPVLPIPFADWLKKPLQ